MEQLNTLDAGFLMAEDSDRNVSLAIGGIAIVDGKLPNHEKFKAVLAERVQSIPRCMQMLRTQPFDLGAPQWVADPAFDIDRHVRRIAVPRPGDDNELFRVVADVLERRLDRDRPLWECWVIEGLKGNRWAILMKVHHCMADGISATRILARLCDEMDGDVFARPVVAKRGGRRPKHLASVPENPARSHPLNNLWRTATGLTNTVTRTVGGATEIAAGLMRPTAGSSLVGPVTAMRKYRAVRVPLTDVEQICNKFDVTINDVALAAITEGYRSVLLHRGEQPRPDSLRTLVPVSVRGGESADQPGNKISIMLPYLPVEEDDPLQQLRAVHSRMTRTKQGGQKQAGNMAVSVTGYVPFMFSSWLIRLLTRLPQRGIVTLATNVPGPHRRLEMMGGTVSRLLPIPPIALQLRTGVAIMSYADDLVFGITADYDAGSDIEVLADGIKIAVSRLDMLSQDSILLFDRKSV
ncbi:wax ester/triacylglycerol synthase family O-acyltransferase [Candidatus Mycobacterium wuenschmannii]|uniref:Diacylglycerol O-acyltransferase n=1 Tax=Candidatus Mycobacterium wuenschmannii TaxID=3027808 RepID=A0ABY8VXG3_9MYCO|nr:wax ester/triacylglycerol synthase family O-acyltransferase [Candidatus Mycobacterium wuenschmannii]WIM87700.1 wax ester/triacylglycerol synthase family O-acyltransferase [Candidatus Mycobacterium wuenschmannii]